MYLSWIIPAYNEERRIQKTLREVDGYLRGQGAGGERGGYEIIVVDSSSPDRTAEIVTDLERSIPNLRLISVENRGKGWAVREGMLRAKGTIRLFSDADNSTAPEYFGAMAPFFREGYDLVISSRDPRDAPGATRGHDREPWYRQTLSKLGNFMIQLFGVWGIWDTQNGFKAFSAQAAQDVFSRSRIPGFAFDIEVLAIARRLRYRIGVIPIRWRFDPDSKVTLAAYLKVFADLFRIRWNLLTSRYGKLLE